MPKHSEKMSDNAIADDLHSHIEQAINMDKGDVAREREYLFNSYLGNKYEKPEPGYSSFVTREVLEGVEWAMPTLMRVFAGTDTVVAFEPTAFDDEAKAEKETQVVNAQVMRANGGNGFLTLYNIVKDSLIAHNAYAKVWVEETDEVRTDEYMGVSQQQIVEIYEDPNHEILEMTEHKGSFFELLTYDVKCKITDKKLTLRVDSIPQNEVLVSRDCTTLNLEEAIFVAHKVRRTYTELVEDGFDRELLDSVPADNREDVEEENRNFRTDEEQRYRITSDPSTEKYLVYECYVKMDTDGDGLAENRRIVMINKTIFENEEMDYKPIVAFSAIGVPHKHVGIAFAELLSEIQKLCSVLTQQLLNNLYLQDRQRVFISENSLLENGQTLGALNDRTAEYVPVKGLARDAAFLEPVPVTFPHILPIIQDARMASATRTGVSGDNAVNKDLLQRTTATTFTTALDKANDRLELMIRLMGETGFKWLYSKVHALNRKHPALARSVNVNGDWIESDPSEWRERSDVKVNVGAIHTNKERMLSILSELVQVQMQLLGSGLVTKQQLYNTLAEGVDAVGLVPGRHFINPSNPAFQEPPPPPPDPAAQLVAAQAQLAQASAQSLQSEQQRKVLETQLDQQNTLKRAELDARKLALEERTKELSGVLSARKTEVDERGMDNKEFLANAQVMKAGVEASKAGTAEIDKLSAEAQKAQAETEKIEAETEQIRKGLNLQGDSDAE